MERVYLCTPSADGSITIHTHAAIVGAMLNAAKRGMYVEDRCSQSSLLAYGFNQFWCEALNLRKERGFNRFVMLHADVQPVVHDWMDRLLAIMERKKVDVVSAIVPIKNQTHNDTSTAAQTPNGPRRRLTLDEVAKMPATFDNEWFKEQTGEILMLNTGCMAIRLTAPWVEEFCFNISDQLLKDDKGNFVPAVMPEDWQMSLQLDHIGVRYAATREIPLYHWGVAAYPAHFEDKAEKKE